MQKFPEDWDLKTKIDYLQRKIILNSIAYYMFDRSPISDKEYDSLCKQLVRLHEEYGDISDTQYGYVMYDFDGTTGFDLYDRLDDKDRSYLMKISSAGLGMEPKKAQPKRKEVDKIQQKKQPLLYDYQIDAIKKMQNGCVLNGGVGSGKSRTALAYYYIMQGGKIDSHISKRMVNPKDLYIITTARKRDTLEWDGELAVFRMSTGKDSGYKNKVVVDSWNNIKKYKDITGAFFIFDEQRVIGSGEWVKSFLKIARGNDWILLSATPGDTWQDYIPVFIANGFYKNRTEFNREHIIFSRFTKYPKVDRYINTGRLISLRNRILIDMDFSRKTRRHDEDVYCEYDIHEYKQLGKTRWNPWKNKPIENASELCYSWRKIVNSDESRQVALLEIFEKHPKIIVFYNFDYELDILKSMHYGADVVLAEWNGHKHQPIPDSDRWLYLVQYNAGAEGWNCIDTDTIVFYSQNYSYKTVEQSKGRIDRLNTPYTDLYYYHLKSRSAIDIAITKALRERKNFNEGQFTKWSK